MQVDYLKRLQRFNSSILTLYRGQIMTWNNLENKFRINKGNLVSMNSFFINYNRCFLEMVLSKIRKYMCPFCMKLQFIPDYII